ncbi:hypothetical protein [Formosa algae]|uniref:Lipoprotein n=1 Tax=Formosa algae TaxID=225843 RepID=A0A9X0YM24_9FLAO|nr:hypothetical protein [Formosa algae]MBP1841076.1 hypothetical protein [Formosa algae]MDQ0336504.1 hypothetical protein [Formosa algae]OEI81462.1 hypothetical protein AST99_04290 [Formosa algae]
MKINHLHITGVITVILLIMQSCASVPYVSKHNLQGPIKSMEVRSFVFQNDKDSLLLQKQDLVFTKAGRVQHSVTTSANNDTLQTTEKKLFFEKQIFPDLPNYYCKTRWKTNQRERISCYSQKKHKQNEKIMYYGNDGRILKRKDQFTTFNTYDYFYDEAVLKSIAIKTKSGTTIDTIQFKCLNRDTNKNCVTLEQHYTVSDSLIRLYRTITYN